MLVGKGASDRLLSQSEVFDLCAEAFAKQNLDGKRILAIIPDLTRTAPIDMMFRVVYELTARQTARLDFLIALGTHPPLSDERINQRVGITRSQRAIEFSKARFFNHDWSRPGQLQEIGVISEDEVEEISQGLMRQEVTVRINKMIFDYDLLLIIGPTFPHEVVGFSGGSKYLFPGIAGQEIIDMFHWLGALITSPVIIGTKETPVRRMIDRAAEFVAVEQLCMSLVVKDAGLAGLYIGTPKEAWRQAASLSEDLHIVCKETPFRSVLSRAPLMYDDLWTGAKCAYKLEPVVADGGELIIYAPHIDQVSATHGNKIEEIGYHVRDYFLKQMKNFQHIPAGVLAHSTHVKGVGRYEKGIETPRIGVTLATQIPEETCAEINLGYRDPGSIIIEEWENRESEGLLYVPRGGETLFRLHDDLFKK
jgi:nickel-dependent lactate racemase